MDAKFSPVPALRAAEAWRGNGAGYVIPCNNAEIDTLGTVAIAIGLLWGVPVILGADRVLNSLFFEVTVAGAAGSVARVGLYDNDPVLFKPRNLLADSGSFDCTVIGVKQSALLSIPLAGDQLYWLAYLAGVSAPTVRIGNGTTGTILGMNSANLSSRIVGVSVAQAFGALPTPFTPGSARQTGGYPLLALSYT